jgi:hypothetical protein
MFVRNRSHYSRSHSSQFVAIYWHALSYNERFYLRNTGVLTKQDSVIFFYKEEVILEVSSRKNPISVNEYDVKQHWIRANTVIENIRIDEAKCLIKSYIRLKLS